MPYFIALGLATDPIVSGRVPAQRDIRLSAVHGRPRKREVGDDARPLGIGLIVVCVPGIVTVFGPGGGGADTGAVTMPNE